MSAEVWGHVKAGIRTADLPGNGSWAGYNKGCTKVEQKPVENSAAVIGTAIAGQYR